jgi:hypothetical protein
MQKQVLPSLVNPAAQLWQNRAEVTQDVQMALQGLHVVAPNARKVLVAQRQVVPCRTKPALQLWQLVGLSWQLVQPTPQLRQAKLALR